MTQSGGDRELIVMGASLGGLNAVGEILKALPAGFPVPIAVTMHRYRTSNEALPQLLERNSNLKVIDADDKTPIRPGVVCIAPANYHLLVEPGVLNLSVDEAVSWSRPSIDVLFESAADAYRGHVVGVLLTGANSDGARGAARIKAVGGFVIVQDPNTAEAPAMPEAAIRQTRVDRILPLDRIGPFLVELCRASVATA